MSNFIDEATIFVESGKGGNGMIHFRREKYVPRGGPDGGDGGKGGDVILEVNKNLNTLFHFKNQNRYHANDGGNGGTSKKTGRSADNLIIQVPPGTLVYNQETGDVVVDLTEDGQQFVVCQGGRGGRGNTHFRNSRNQIPRIAEKGEPGESKTLRLELKLIADVGLVGVPNAGKSTLLASVTNAKPKIASYPFTTLIPNLGVAVLDSETSLILADIPGLIEGAHLGVGLGHDFLKHIQRTRVLIHLLDGLAEDPVADFIQINTELSLFDPGLGEKPQIVVLNKMDLPEVSGRWLHIQTQIKKMGYEELLAISAVTGQDVRKLLYKTHDLLTQTPAKPEPLAKPVYRFERDPRDFFIGRDQSGWHVIGEGIERAAQMTYWDYDQSLRRFQRILETLGIDQALREAGIQPGDTVYIGDQELEWSE